MEESHENPYLDPETVDQMRELLGPKFIPVVQLFLNDTQNHLNVIERALAAEAPALKIVDIMRAAHSLRASSAHIGANGISDAAAALEDGAHAAEVGQPVDFMSLQDNLRKSFDQARQGLERLLAA